MSDTRGYHPIAGYGLIGDGHGSALVARDASVDWCVFRRFDRPSVFGRILDRDKGGHLSVALQGGEPAGRSYLPGTNILQTMLASPSCTVSVLDCMPVVPDPRHRLTRIVRCERGGGAIRLEIAPRFDHGLTLPRIERHESGALLAYGGADALSVQCFGADLRLDATTCRAEIEVRAGDEICVVVDHQRPHAMEPQATDRDALVEEVRATERWWSEWAGRCRYEGPYAEHVTRSALVLKALIFRPTGAIVAAPTTSLPEWVGGGRNWDYRFAWLRDASLHVESLFELGYEEEAHSFMSWSARTTAGRAQDVRVLYGVEGEHLVSEDELPLEGYMGSRPVRIGNRAEMQFQLDTLGELLDAAWRYATKEGRIGDAFWDLIVDVVDLIEARWEGDDAGIWELRGGSRQLVVSKAMAWVGVDRALRVAEEVGRDAPVRHWRELGERIRKRVELEGPDPTTGAFTQTFGHPEMDAAALLIGLLGFLPPDDARMRATRERIEAELGAGGPLLYRYKGSDGFDEPEGAFVACTFWLVRHLVAEGERERARALFEAMLDHTNDVGLLSEEIDPESGEMLGNFPQALSHIGLIRAALDLDPIRDASDRAPR